MQRIADVTLGDIGRAVSRYRPFIAIVIAISLIVFLAPDPSTSGSDAIDGVTGTSSADSPGLTGSSSAKAAKTSEVPKTTANGRVGAAPTPSELPSSAMAPDCDPATGRMRIPSLYSPPCLAAFFGSNGGATTQGVTKDTITVVLYHCENAAQSAVFKAQNADDDLDVLVQNFRDWIQLWQSYLRTYGRKVTLTVMGCSAGNTTDDAAGKADAVKVATEIKAFAVLTARGSASVSSAFVKEAAARKVLVIGPGGLGDDFYRERAPFVWGAGGPGLHQLYGQVGEYIGKRLWGRKARWAGDVAYQQRNRSLGLIYTDTPDGANRPAEKFFEQELGRYGAKLTDRVAQIYDLSRGQEYARNIVARFKEKGVTSVITAGNYLMLVFITQEATRQRYFPEWVMAGNAALGTRTVGRLQDQVQWGHAFGPNGYWVRGPTEQYEPYFLYHWHFGRPPGAKGYEVFYHYPRILMFGVHLAGPRLTPESFRDGLFRYPLSGGGLMTPKVSWGRHELYDWDDYAPEDDLGHSWWDPNATGVDEFGRQGRGVHRWMEGGRRRTRGQWPNDEPKMFQTAGTVSEYETLPPEEKPPQYPPKRQP